MKLGNARTLCKNSWQSTQRLRIIGDSVDRAPPGHPRQAGSRPEEVLCLLGALHITSNPVWQIIDRPGSTGRTSRLDSPALPLQCMGVLCPVGGVVRANLASTSSEEEDNTATLPKLAPGGAHPRGCLRTASRL